jgi:phage baseplate assembly protein V
MNTLDRLRNRLLLMIGRGRIKLVDDSGPVQTVQVAMQGGDVHDLMPRLAEYGLATNPPAGADALVLKLGGDHSHGVVAATGHQASRPRGLPAGATMLYDTHSSKVLLNADGTLTVHAQANVRVETPGASVALTTTAVTLQAGTAMVALAGGSVAITAPGGLTINGAQYRDHQHTNVQSGSGNSGGVA